MRFSFIKSLTNTASGMQPFSIHFGFDEGLMRGTNLSRSLSILSFFQRPWHQQLLYIQQAM